MKRDVRSSIDRLPVEIREEIGRLRREDGATIDEILAHLRTLDVAVSRSALGRHVAKLSDIAERLRRSRHVADALVSQFGDQPDNKLQRANLELMHAVVMQTITAAAEDEEGNPQPVTFDPEQVMFLARALQSLSSAEKTNADRILKARQESAKKAGDAARARGLSQETIDFITNQVLGVAS